MNDCRSILLWRFIKHFVYIHVGFINEVFLSDSSAELTCQYLDLLHSWEIHNYISDVWAEYDAQGLMRRSKCSYTLTDSRAALNDWKSSYLHLQKSRKGSLSSSGARVCVCVCVCVWFTVILWRCPPQRVLNFLCEINISHLWLSSHTHTHSRYENTGSDHFLLIYFLKHTHTHTHTLWQAVLAFNL